MKLKDVWVISIKIKVDPWFWWTQEIYKHICLHVAGSGNTS